MNERLHEERNRELSGSERNVVKHQQRLRNVTANLPHETGNESEKLDMNRNQFRLRLLEVSVFKNVPIFQIVTVVLPNPVFKLFVK